MFRAKNYVKAASLEEAYELNQKKSNVVAGGFLWLKMGDRNKQTMIDLSGLSLDTIEETEEEFTIGAMCTLRMMETHEGLQNYFGDGIKNALRHIVGVQFRNGATVGGSIFGRFGFSDVLTCLLVLDTNVELYREGIVTLEEFAASKRNRDILVRIIIKKDGRNLCYQSLRHTSTDLPVLNCAMAMKDEECYIAVGARPSRASLYKGNLTVQKDRKSEAEKLAETAADKFSYGSNLRGSASYRKHLAQVLIKRGAMELTKEEQNGNNVDLES